MMNVQPISLAGKVVRLEPLSELHIPALAEAGSYDEIWRLMVYGMVRTEEQMGRLVRELLERQSDGTDLPFVVILQETGRVIGSTRYMEIRPEHRGLEIGGTWYTPAYQRTAVNTECKYLLLTHAFEALGCVRVQFKTDLRNIRSQKALERIGAVQEGILRKQVILPDGYIRDSVYYSIIDSEWPVVKYQLEQKLVMAGG